MKIKYHLEESLHVMKWREKQAFDEKPSTTYNGDDKETIM